MSLPLPRDFFTCPPLSPGDHGTLLAQAERLCHDTVLNAVTMARAPPTKVLVNAFTKRRAQLHAGTDIYAPEHYGITGSSQIKASYDELYDFFHLNSDDKVRTYGKVLGQAVVDRQTLYNLSAPGATTSPMHAGVQWSVIACPFISSAITLKRDSCFLEVLDTITFDDKATGRRRRGFVRAIHSIALDCCPSLRQSHSIVRSSFVRSGHVFLETSVPGLFDHYFAYVIGDPGLTPKFFNLKVCERMVGQMLNLEPHLALKRLPALLLGGASRPSYRSGARITYCESCDTKFQFLRSKHHCYHCRQIVCRRCIQAYKVPVLDDETAPVVRLCTYCFCGNTPQRSMRGGRAPPTMFAMVPRHDSVDEDARWTNSRPVLERDGSSSEASFVTASYSAASPRILLDLGDSFIASGTASTVQLYHQ